MWFFAIVKPKWFSQTCETKSIMTSKTCARRLKKSIKDDPGFRRKLYLFCRSFKFWQECVCEIQMPEKREKWARLLLKQGDEWFSRHATSITPSSGTKTPENLQKSFFFMTKFSMRIRCGRWDKIHFWTPNEFVWPSFTTSDPNNMISGKNRHPHWWGALGNIHVIPEKKSKSISLRDTSTPPNLLTLICAIWDSNARRKTPTHRLVLRTSTAMANKPRCSDTTSATYMWTRTRLKRGPIALLFAASLNTLHFVFLIFGDFKQERVLACIFSSYRWVELTKRNNSARNTTRHLGYKDRLLVVFPFGSWCPACTLLGQRIDGHNRSSKLIIDLLIETCKVVLRAICHRGIFIERECWGILPNGAGFFWSRKPGLKGKITSVVVQWYTGTSVARSMSSTIFQVTLRVPVLTEYPPKPSPRRYNSTAHDIISRIRSCTCSERQSTRWTQQIKQRWGARMAVGTTLSPSIYSSEWSHVTVPKNTSRLTPK